MDAADKPKSTVSREPLSPAAVRKIMAGVIKDQRIVLPSPNSVDLRRLTRTLNDLQAHFKFAQETGNKSKGTADRVSGALSVLVDFFHERGKAIQEDNGLRPETIKNEKRLLGAFGKFMKALQQHSFDLSMDAAVLMPELRGWHSYTEILSGSFKLAMAGANPDREFGQSNDGPVARFVAAIIPHITGETPTVGAVSKRLKDTARHRRKVSAPA
jgi:hypothetical protein